ncbi:MAG: MiaB/RimO family radical SAM methylthiotransferase [bacterium]|nr:MiaB/RimO family radical SAM methylthiotransferase [bacterium]
MPKYHIITIGCQMNKSDSERLASALEKQGYQWSSDKYKANLVAVNTCGVRQSAEDRLYGLIPEIKKKNKKSKIVVTGCLVYREDIRRRLKKYVDLWLPINKIFNFQINAKCGDYLKIVPKYESKFSAFVPIGNGCDNFCSYCVVPYARGREVWRPAKEILEEVKSLVKMKYKEIILIAQNVNSYKSRNPQPATRSQKIIDFADLLKMVNDIPGDFKLKFLTSHPKDMSDKLIKIMAKCEKFCRQVHLPAQSGDDEVLKKMNRKYTAGHYVKLVGKIKKAMPDAEISTDIIVGFCGETKKQFSNTVKLMKKIKFNQAYIARYTPRPGTAAYKIKDNVSREEKKRRWQVLNSLIAYGKK